MAGSNEALIQMSKEMEKVIKNLGIPVRVFAGTEEGSATHSVGDATEWMRQMEESQKWMEKKVVVPLILFKDDKFIGMSSMPVVTPGCPLPEMERPTVVSRPFTCDLNVPKMLSGEFSITMDYGPEAVNPEELAKLKDAYERYVDSGPQRIVGPLPGMNVIPLSDESWGASALPSIATHGALSEPQPDVIIIGGQNPAPDIEGTIAMKTSDTIANWRHLNVLHSTVEASKEMSRTMLQLRRRRMYPEIDLLLAALDVNEWPRSFLITVLIAVSGEARSLAQLAPFGERVRARFVADLGPEEAKKELLGMTV